MNPRVSSQPERRAEAPTPEDARRRLESWKEIAAYLGRSEKTVRRWEETADLPVYRLRHEKRCSVYAYSCELEAWREGRKEIINKESAVSGEGIKGDGQVLPSDGLQQTNHLLSHKQLPWLVLLVVAVSMIWPLTSIEWSRIPGTGKRASSPVRIQSLAVLPFENLSGDSAQDYFADGMTEQLITELARLSSVRVISRTSVMSYKRTRKSKQEIARELNVEAIVEGALLRTGTQVRMTFQLITPSPERHLWARTFESDLSSVLDLPRDAAREIENRIQSELDARLVTNSSIGQHHLDPETYETYLRGRHFLAQRNAEAMNKALGYFEATLRRDTLYAPAYAALAVTYDLLGMYEVLSPDKAFAKVKALAGAALRLDDTLAEAYTARAIASSFWDFDWSSADADFRRALSLEPNLAFAHHWYGEHWVSIGKAERAVSELKRARELDPLSLPINGTLGRVYRDAHQYENAVDQCRRTIELDPHFAMGHWCLSQVYLAQKNYGAAIAELELANDLGATPLVLRDLGWAYAAHGEIRKAREILKRLSSSGQSSYISPYSIATIHAALGERDEAFQWLRKAYNEKDSQITYLALDPEIDPLRSDPRFRPLLKRLDLPP